MRFTSLPTTGTMVLVFLLSASFFMGCSSKEDPKRTQTEKPVVQDMDIEAPVDEDKVPMH